MSIGHIAIIVVIIIFFIGMVYGVWNRKVHNLVDTIIYGLVWATWVVIPGSVILVLINLWKITA